MLWPTFQTTLGMPMTTEADKIVAQRPVQVYMALSPQGLALWSTVKYPTEDNVIVVRPRSLKDAGESYD
jgi:hypothetical protein